MYTQVQSGEELVGGDVDNPWGDWGRRRVSCRWKGLVDPSESMLNNEAAHIAHINCDNSDGIS